jgi:hypothetical protein
MRAKTCISGVRVEFGVVKGGVGAKEVSVWGWGRWVGVFGGKLRNAAEKAFFGDGAWVFQLRHGGCNRGWQMVEWDFGGREGSWPFGVVGTK